MYCKEIPYDAAKFDSRDTMVYGQWLKAELKEHSPFWQSFYAPHALLDQPEESIPETPPSQLPNAPPLPPASCTTKAMIHLPVAPPSHVPTGTNQLHSQMEHMDEVPSHTALIPATVKQKGIQLPTMDTQTHRKLKHSKMIPIMNAPKKQKRYTPYDKKKVYCYMTWMKQT